MGVLLARAPDGASVNVVFGSQAALAAWSPLGSTSLALPAPVVLANLAASGLPAILDPAGPIPYRFEPDELAALAAGRIPETGEPLTVAGARTSVRVRLPGPDTKPLERALAGALAAADAAVQTAYLVETDGPDGPRLLLGLVGAGGPMPISADEADVTWLSEPLLSHVQAVAEPFYRRAG